MLEDKTPTVVISQLPPPIHGSTVMTRVLLDTLIELKNNAHLVDRRFSSTIDEVGKFRWSKVSAAVHLVLRLMQTCYRLKPSKAIFFATTRVPSFLVDWLLAETLNFFKIPTVLYLHSQGFGDLRDRNPLFRTAARRLFSNASRVVCLSPRLYNDVSSLVEKEKVTFVANALLSEPNLADQGKDVFAAQRRRVLFLSNLLPEKGIDTFVNLAMEYCHDSLDTVFDIVGPATYELQIEKYRERVRSAGYERNIFFHGAQADEQKWNILSSSSLLVFPSMLNEAQPLTIVEAFACGVPVIAYANGGIPDMIDSGTNGVLVEPGDSAGLLQAVKGALASTEWRLSAGRAASHSYELNHSRSRFRDAWSELLGQIRVERR